jgi:hypothetical protein
MRNAEILKQAHQQRLHFGVSQTGKSKIKGTLTFEVANLEILKEGGPSIFGKDTWLQINISLTERSKEGVP